MNPDRVWSHQSRNLLHSLLLLGGMVLLLTWIGGVFFETPGITLALVAVAALFTLGRLSPRWVLKMHRARGLLEMEAPALHQFVRELSGRAGLASAPVLYLVPSPGLNAFAVGTSDDSAIGVTQGLLRSLNRRQLAGVLAHEISHIRHHDLWVMGLARLVGQMIRGFSLLGQLLLLLSFPAVLMAGYQIPWDAVLILVAAPTLSSLLLLALSRTREFEADLGAARLTGDPLGLASALTHLEAQQGGWWRLFFPLARRTSTSFLDSHPVTAQRVDRLRSLVDHTSPSSERADPRRRPTPIATAPRRGPVRIPVRLVDHGPSRWPQRAFD